MPSESTELLCKAVDERRDELVELTRSLIRFPTVNPPGEAYRPCAEFMIIATRLHSGVVNSALHATTPNVVLVPACKRPSASSGIRRVRDRSSRVTHLKAFDIRNQVFDCWTKHALPNAAAPR